MFNPNDPALDPIRYACTESGNYVGDLESAMLAVEVAVEFLGASVEAIVPFVAGKLADRAEARLRHNSSGLDSASRGDIQSARDRQRQILLLRNIANRTQAA